MIYFARTLYVTAAALGVGCIFLFVALIGRRGRPLIDAPEYIPWTIAGFVFCFGIVLLAQVMGNDLAPHLPGRKRPAPAPKPTPVMDPADAQKIYDHFQGDNPLSPQDLHATFDRFSAAREAAMTPAERARRDEIVQLQVDTAPVRLQVMVPPQPSDSWIGGNPSMPPDMPWPEVDGKPATFFAQIAAHHLPADIWGWQGPRSGWLLFFGGDQGYGGGTILHTTSLGQERRRPYGQVFRYYRYGRYDAQAQQMMGDQGLQPPKWPVSVVPADGGARPANQPEVHPNHGFDLTQEAWKPFDWPTLSIFLAELIGQTRWHMNLRQKRFSNALPPHEEARLTSLDALMPPLETLSELIRKRSEEAEFTTAERDRILNPILALEYDKPDYTDGKFHKMTRGRIAAFVANSEYPALHDLRARHIYAADPAALSVPVRDMLEPKWQAIAASEVTTMGGSGAKFERDGDAVMLELVPSRLFGWTFGDYSNFAIVLDKGALLDGKLDQAETVDNHGI